MFQRSDVYRSFFKKGKIKEAKALLNDGEFRRFNDYIQRNAFQDIIETIDTSELNDKETCIAIDSYINSYPDYTREVLIAGEVPVKSYMELNEKTSFSSNEIIKFIGELQSVVIKSSEAVKMIFDYDFYTNELKQWFNVEPNLNAPIYSGLYIAKTTYNMYKNKGLLAYRQYAAQFDQKYSEYTIGEHKVKLLNSDDVSKLSVGMLPIEDVTSPLIGVYSSKGILLSLVANCSGKIMINGSQKDEIKATVNTFLDLLEKQQ